MLDVKWRMLWASVAGSGALALAACGSSSQEGNGGSGASSGTGGAAGVGAGVNIGANSSGGASGFGGECAGQVFSGERAPLDMFVMMDISDSMRELTADGSEKWTAVKDALIAFLSDQRSAGLGVGIQYFPLRKPGVPATCTANAQCGANGPCVLNLCWGGAGQLTACQTDADCLSAFADLRPCAPFGVCQNDSSYLCPNPGTPCLADPPVTGLGNCVAQPSFCALATDCNAAAYGTPAVAIAELPAAADALVASIDAQRPSGNTPTGPALQGAIAHAQSWASSHAGHTVATLLVTDGLPTECAPVEIPNVGRVAAGGLAANVRTFVVGVFGPADAMGGASPQQNLDTIAVAGGTERAYLVDTSGDVTAQFLDALNAIRGRQLTCEFLIPEPSGSAALDYGRVNVQWTEGGSVNSLYFVQGTDGANCPSEGGWYYDTDPAVAPPTTITFCPATCGAVQAGTGASVQIQLGCQTMVR